MIASLILRRRRAVPALFSEDEEGAVGDPLDLEQGGQLDLEQGGQLEIEEPAP